jgi:hypothetical protein
MNSGSGMDSRPPWNDRPAEDSRPPWDFRPAVVSRPPWDGRPAVSSRPPWDNRPTVGTLPPLRARPSVGSRPPWEARPLQGDIPPVAAKAPANAQSLPASDPTAASGRAILDILRRVDAEHRDPERYCRLHEVVSVAAQVGLKYRSAGDGLKRSPRQIRFV